MKINKLISTVFAAAVAAAFFAAGLSAQAPKTAAEGTLKLVRSVPVEAQIESPLALDALSVWTQAFSNAKETIDMSFFYYIMEQGQPGENLQNLILGLAQKGIKIRMIADKSFYGKMPDFVNDLKDKENIDIRIIDFGALTTGVMHAKYFIVDGRTVFMGSQNFDWRALSQIHEIGLLMDNAEIARVFTQVFEMDWNMALTAKKETPQDLPKYKEQTLSYKGKDVQIDIAASPKNLVPKSIDWDFDKLLAILKNSKKTIDMQVLSYSLKKYNEKGQWTELQDALIETAKRGVTLNLLFSSWTKPDQIEALSKQKNINIRISTIKEASTGPIEFARVEHCKYLIADGKITWVSTSNWSYDYFYNSRNMAVIVYGESFAKDMKEIFNLSWNGKHSAPFKMPQKKAKKPAKEERKSDPL